MKMVKKTYVLGGKIYYKEVKREAKPKKRKKTPRYGRGNGFFICLEWSPQHKAIIGVRKHILSVLGKFHNYEEIAVALWDKHHKEFGNKHEVAYFRLIYAGKGIKKRTWILVKRQPLFVKRINTELEENFDEKTSDMVEKTKKRKGW